MPHEIPPIQVDLTRFGRRTSYSEYLDTLARVRLLSNQQADEGFKALIQGNEASRIFIDTLLADQTEDPRGNTYNSWIVQNDGTTLDARSAIVVGIFPNVVRYLSRIFYTGVVNNANYIADSGDEFLDLSQDIFVKIFSNISRHREDSSLWGYVTTIIKNEFRDYIADKQKYRKLFEFLPGDEASLDAILATYAPSALEEVEAAHTREITREELEELLGLLHITEKLRSAVRLVYVFPDASHRELATLLGISEDVFNSRLFAARRTLSGRRSKVFTWLDERNSDI